MNHGVDFFSARPGKRRLLGRGFRALALGAFCAGLASSGPLADGLHCRILDGDDLGAAWRRLVRETWPGRTKAPRRTVHRSPRVKQAIQELIAVIHFVDPYNYADDSPAWMSTEEGREKARTQARAALIELGRGAAGAVWEALALELRFQDARKPPDRFVKPFRKAQQMLKSVLELLQSQRRQDEAYRLAHDEYEKIRPKLNTLKFLKKEAARLRRLKVSVSRDPQRLKTVEAEIERVRERRAALGGIEELRARLEKLKAKFQAREKVLDLDPKAAALKASVAAARKTLDAARRSSLGLGQGGEVTGGDPAMVTVEDFTEQLRGLLIEMGPEALPVIARTRRSPNPAVRKMGEGIAAQWRQPKWAKAFAQAAADGHTRVALAAKRFLRKTLGAAALPMLVGALEKAAPAERPALFAALKMLAQVELPDQVDAWTRWWEEQKKKARLDKGQIEEEEE